MLNFSLRHKSDRRVSSSRRAATLRWLSAAILCYFASATFAQTLARPGWTASGFTADPWWKHAVFYRMTRPAGAASVDWLKDPAPVAAKLDDLQLLRIDALILPTPEDQATGTALDAFDDLISQASRRGIRVVLALPVAGTPSALSERVRFWLSRGVAGFYVFTPAEASPAESMALVQTVRGIASSAVGGRIVISDLVSGSAATVASPVSRHRRRHRVRATSSRLSTDRNSASLRIDSHLDLPELPDAATLRKLIADEPQETSVLLDLEPPVASPGMIDPYLALMKSIAAIELTTHPVALIDADADSGDGAVAEWDRRLIALHHGNATLRYGTATPLDFDTQNALVWISRATQQSSMMPPVIVACNLTSSTIHLSLAGATRGLGLRGSFLRTLLRTDDSMGPQGLDDVSLPPFGVYVGELQR